MTQSASPKELRPGLIWEMRMLDWLAYSIDLNSIEQLQEILKRSSMDMKYCQGGIGSFGTGLKWNGVR